jgi:hypothetical protein
MRASWLSPAGVALCFASVGAWAQDGGEPKNPAETAACLECHADPELETELDNGDLVKLYFDKEANATSVHATVDCTECHVELKGKGEKHKGNPLATAREYALKFSEVCRDCHFQNYTKTLDSVHHTLLLQGKKEAAVCTDCHGAHDTGKAAEPRSRISRSCARCHEKIALQYTKSVHGAALLSEENPDVPTCTDCHRAHDILDPRSGAWRLRSPQMCGSCHTNTRMMKKYGLSTGVLSSYLSDFHGVTTTLQKTAQDAQPVVALCTDCHGVHDITKVNDPGSRVIAGNLVRTCQKCHPTATDAFPAAWLSHYEPTLEKAPLVYVVNLFYSLLIPFMIAGLILQIVLHLWRVVVNR